MPVRIRLVRKVVLLLWIASLIQVVADAPDAARPDSSSDYVAAEETQRDHDLPAAGVSLFDRIFSRPTADGFEYDVPYPFEKVRQRITEFQSGMIDLDGSSIAEVLIPMGRSLQRDAARPDFFRFPRILLAVDTESVHRVLTRDRLFIGYQEKAEIMEVISYNETAGRFEFQVVKDYAAGATPKIRYARRVLCMSCHQNAAAIFPVGQWRETNFNMLVARKIGAHHSVYHGVSAPGALGNAGRFDAATDRANLFATYQRLWRRGCGDDVDGYTGRNCRARLFLELLRHRLASVEQPVYKPPKHLPSKLRDNWFRLWPDGLPIPEADLQDRLPALDTLENSMTLGQDPLTLRPPNTYWSYLRAAHETIRGLSESFLLDRDVERLDDYLYARAAMPHTRNREYEGTCSFKLEQEEVEKWLGIECKLVDAAGASLDLVGEFYIRSDGLLNKDMSWLYVSDGTHSVRTSVTGRIKGSVSILQLLKPYHRVHSRLWDERLISRFEIQFDQELPIPLPAAVATVHTMGRARLGITDDFPLVEQVVVKLLARAGEGGFAGFDDPPFQGTELMDALFKELGVTAGNKVTTPTPGTLTLRVDENETAPGFLPGPVLQETQAVQTFRQYCGACHGGDTVLPPGFLAGSIEQIKAQLLHCAPRIAYRLGMWGLAVDRRPKTPMPPLGYLQSASIEPEWWGASEELNVLRDYIHSLLPADGSRAAEPRPLQTDYAELPVCLRS